MKYYAGIGSRDTPDNILDMMEVLAKYLGFLAYTLRSGGAEGADTAFELGVCDHNQKEIYLPWKNFNHDDPKRKTLEISPLFLDALPKEIQWKGAEIAEHYHPRWRALSYGAKKLHTRNVFQIMGKDLNTPVEFVVCWTSDGKASGGTGQALRIAQDKGIQIYNLFSNSEAKTLINRIRKEMDELKATMIKEK